MLRIDSNANILRSGGHYERKAFVIKTDYLLEFSEYVRELSGGWGQ